MKKTVCGGSMKILTIGRVWLGVLLVLSVLNILISQLNLVIMVLPTLIQKLALIAQQAMSVSPVAYHIHAHLVNMYRPNWSTVLKISCLLARNFRSIKNTPVLIVHVSLFPFYIHLKPKTRLAGHKCHFAAAEPTPCPKDQFNTYSNQTTCQECDIGLGQKCYQKSKKDGQDQIIIGQSQISDVLGLSFW